MSISTITLEVDSDTAQAYSAATEEQRRKLQLLLNLRLRELTVAPARSLQEIMDEIGTEAQRQGLTAESLDSLLNDE